MRACERTCKTCRDDPDAVYLWYIVCFSLKNWKVLGVRHALFCCTCFLCPPHIVDRVRARVTARPGAGALLDYVVALRRPQAASPVPKCAFVTRHRSVYTPTRPMHTAVAIDIGASIRIEHLAVFSKERPRKDIEMSVEDCVSQWVTRCK